LLFSPKTFVLLDICSGLFFWVWLPSPLPATENGVSSLLFTTVKLSSPEKLSEAAFCVATTSGSLTPKIFPNSLIGELLP